jgi:hypothetical protein
VVDAVVYKWRDDALPIPPSLPGLLIDADASDAATVAARLPGLLWFDHAAFLARVRRAGGHPSRWVPVDYAVHEVGSVNWVTMTGVPSGLPEACRSLGLYFYTM